MILETQTLSEQMGRKIGYARCSTTHQSTDSQVDDLKAAGCEEVFFEKVSSTADLKDRHQLRACLSVLREGDLILFSGALPHERCLKWGLRGPWNHVGIIVRQARCTAAACAVGIHACSVVARTPKVLDVSSHAEHARRAWTRACWRARCTA